MIAALLRAQLEIDVLQLDLLLRLSLSVVLGAAIGLEREYTGKDAGLRTTILICMGATLFTELSHALAGPGADNTRVAAQIVTGIGFLGAGAILRHGGQIRGLTTAATIWVVAAIGMAVGGRQYIAAVGSTVLVLIVLVPLRWWEKRVEDRVRKAETERRFGTPPRD
jgi:putative Mg2+ transporter-C (MgtC) family protein